MKHKQIKRLFFLFCLLATASLIWIPESSFAQSGTMRGMDHGTGHGMDMPMNHMEKMPPASSLKPAQGASVKILSPEPGQVFHGDEVPLQFKMAKGKIGSHVHAYVDGTLMGMFETEKGTLTGLTPGQHTLEIRVVTADHMIELNATDRVTFLVK